MYRQSIREKVPVGRYYDARRNLLYSSIGKIQSRKNVVVMYNRVWRATPRRQLEGGIQGTFTQSVHIPIVRDFFPRGVTTGFLDVQGNPLSFWHDSPRLSGGDVINIGQASARTAVVNYIRSQLSSTRNSQFFRERPNTKFRLSVRYFGNVGPRRGTAVEENRQSEMFSSTFMSDINQAISRFDDMLEAIAEKYDTHFMGIYDLRIDRLETPLGFGQGATFRSIQQVTKTFVRPYVFTKFNCMFVSCAMHKRIQSDPNILLLPDHTHLEAGENLKRRLRRGNYPHVFHTYATFDTLKSICDYLKLPAKVYNNTFGVEFEYSPERLRRTGIAKNTIELLLHDGHYTPIFRRSKIPANIVERLEQLDERVEDITGASLQKLASKRKIFDQLLQGTPVKIDKESQRLATDDDIEEGSIFDVTGIAAYDLETAPLIVEASREEHKIHKSYMSGIAWYDKETMNQEFVQFEGENCCQEMLAFIAKNASKFMGRTFYGHNAGRFDLPIILKEALFSKWQCTNDFKECPWKIECNGAMELNGGWISFGLTLKDEYIPPGSNKYSRRNKTITFRDSYRMLSAKLDKLAKEFKTPHQKLGDVDHSLVSLDNWKTQFGPLLRRYHENDCRSLLEVLESFGKECERDLKVDIRRCVTIASLSKQAYWRNWAPTEDLYTLPYDIDKFIRASYCGGRCEAFHIGKVNFPCLYYMDFTSLYPYICLGDLPCGLPLSGPASACFDSNNKLIEGFYGFVEVDLETIDDTRLKRKFKPLHAIVNEQRLTFPWIAPGKRVRTILFSEEIRYAQSRGMPYIYHTYPNFRSVSFFKSPILKDMIETCYEKKKQASIAGDNARRHIVKLLLNSSYGWWGLRTRDRDSCVVVDSSDQGSTFQKYLEQDKLLGMGTHTMGGSKSDGEKYFFIRCKRNLDILDHNVAVAAAVTSNARVRLHDAITDFESVDPEARVFYCDTDSMITNVAISQHDWLVRKYQWDHVTNSRDSDGNNLGNLKNEAHDLVKKKLSEHLEMDNGDVFFDECYILGCKMYSVKRNNALVEDVEICKCKGFSQRGDKKLSVADFERLASNKDRVDKLQQKYLDRDISLDAFREQIKPLVLHQEQMQFRTGKHSFLSENNLMCAVEIVQVEKIFKTHYTKGYVNPDTGRVVPLEIDRNDMPMPDLLLQDPDDDASIQLLTEMQEDENPEHIDDVFDGDDDETDEVEIEYEYDSDEDVSRL